MAMVSIKDKKGNTTLHVAMVNGISTITRGMPVCLTLQDDYLVIRQRFTKNASIVLRCSQITKIQAAYQKELVVKNASGAGDAATGEMLGICNISIKSKTKNPKGKDYIVITYQASSSKVIIFEKIEGTTIGANVFIEEVKERANIGDAAD